MIGGPENKPQIEGTGPTQTTFLHSSCLPEQLSYGTGQTSLLPFKKYNTAIVSNPSISTFSPSSVTPKSQIPKISFVAPSPPPPIIKDGYTFTPEALIEGCNTPPKAFIDTCSTPPETFIDACSTHDCVETKDKQKKRMEEKERVGDKESLGETESLLGVGERGRSRSNCIEVVNIATSDLDKEVIDISAVRKPKKKAWASVLMRPRRFPFPAPHNRTVRSQPNLLEPVFGTVNLSPSTEKVAMLEVAKRASLDTRLDLELRLDSVSTSAVSTARPGATSPRSLEAELCYTYSTRDKLHRGSLRALKREANSRPRRRFTQTLDEDLVEESRQKTSLFGLLHTRKVDHAYLRYFFQHPYARMFVSYSVMFCNFLLFAEDPVSHSKTEASIPVMGNVFSFVFTKYPPRWLWILFKVLMWLLAVTCGMVVGKTILHGVILSRLFRLKMFRDDQGSWMVQCLTVIISLYLFSHLYNMILVLFYEHVSRDLTINSMMTITHSSVMKAAACGTWTGGLITALIITDMMLQDTVYPDWAPGVRAVWQRSQIPRILLFWAGSIIIATMVILVIVTDWINWDKLNRDFVATSELSRAFLASCILVMDLTIVMQDWDFPHFTTTLDVNLPGFHKHAFNFQAMEIQISGKWFNYGIIFLVMILDLNMWKNQMFYKPQNYGQYVGPFNRVYTVTNQTILEMSGNLDYRATTINPETKKPYSDEDLYMNSRYMGYTMMIKSVMIIPCLLGFATFLTMTAVYGRYENPAKRVTYKDQEVAANDFSQLASQSVLENLQMADMDHQNNQ